MKTNKLYSILAAIVALVFVSCNPNPVSEEDLFNKTVNDYIQPGDTLWHLNDFVARFMTETGDEQYQGKYRTRSEINVNGKLMYLFSLNNLPTDGPGHWIQGRVTTDDYGGNFYKSIIIQEIVDGEQQNLRLSVDVGSASGLYQMGQQVLIRVNGLAIGRYANQPQLCVPSYNDNVYAQHADQKVGWAPGRISASKFKEVCHLIGQPDPSQIVYDIITPAEFENIIHYDWAEKTYYKGAINGFDYTAANQEAALLLGRQLDGRLVRIENMHCTREYDNYGLTLDCVHYTSTESTGGNPQLDKNACCFGPTTEGVGYPQGRYFALPTDPGSSVGNEGIDQRRIITISTSEYAKYAYYYLPTSDYVGTVTGILSMYCDNGAYAPAPSDWAITPRNVMVPSNSCTIDDIDLYRTITLAVDSQSVSRINRDQWGGGRKPDVPQPTVTEKWIPVEWSADVVQGE